MKAGNWISTHVRHRRGGDNPDRECIIDTTWTGLVVECEDRAQKILLNLSEEEMRNVIEKLNRLLVAREKDRANKLL